ncbi:MAG: hypothetical protein IJW86_10480, partial [Clostridia bacterium]|nr:hypothetical protein [Clostridia bacterium]
RASLFKTGFLNGYRYFLLFPKSVLSLFVGSASSTSYFDSRSRYEMFLLVIRVGLFNDPTGHFMHLCFSWLAISLT